MYDAPVHVHKTVLMQRLLDAVSRGYHWHTSGVVPIHKARRLADKFAERYGVDRNANRRAYAKRKGRANARLFLWHTGGTEIQWWLLATDGAGVIHEEERLHDALDRRRRIRIGDDYELVRRTRRSDRGGGTVWTWRMTRECYASWRDHVLAVCRKNDRLAVRQTIGSLYRTPGFSGIREQVGKLMSLMRGEWRRRHGRADILIARPRLPYLERLHNVVVPISDFAENVRGMLNTC